MFQSINGRVAIDLFRPKIVAICHDLVTSTTDNSTYFAESLGIQSIEGRLYSQNIEERVLINYKIFTSPITVIIGMNYIFLDLSRRQH